MKDEMEQVALFDMDGTLADYDAAMLADLEKLRSEHEPPLTFERLHDLPGPWEARRKLIVQRPGWWRALPVLDVGFSLFVTAYRCGFTPHILTKGPRHCPNAWKEKVEWCFEQLLLDEVKDREPITRENLDIHVVSDKGLVYGKMLVDDYPPYIEAWLKHRPRGLVLMPAHPYNANFHHLNVIRCGGDDNRWEYRSLQAMIAAYNRKPSEPLVL